MISVWTLIIPIILKSGVKTLAALQALLQLTGAGLTRTQWALWCSEAFLTFINQNRVNQILIFNTKPGGLTRTNGKNVYSLSDLSWRILKVYQMRSLSWISFLTQYYFFTGFLFPMILFYSHFHDCKIIVTQITFSHQFKSLLVLVMQWARHPDSRKLRGDTEDRGQVKIEHLLAEKPCS